MAACQAPWSMGFSRQEYWKGSPFPSPDLPNPGIEPGSPAFSTFPLNWKKWKNVNVKPLSHVSSRPPWSVARQALMSMGVLQARFLEWVAISFSIKKEKRVLVFSLQKFAYFINKYHCMKHFFMKLILRFFSHSKIEKKKFRFILICISIMVNSLFDMYIECIVKNCMHINASYAFYFFLYFY